MDKNKQNIMEELGDLVAQDVDGTDLEELEFKLHYYKDDLTGAETNILKLKNSFLENSIKIAIPDKGLKDLRNEINDYLDRKNDLMGGGDK